MLRMALATFSRTSLAASLISRSSTNRTVICPRPSAMRAWISSMPETPLIACSIGSMTVVDISSGLAPGSESVTLTVAGSAFGKRSTPRPRKEKIPSTTSDMTSIVADTGRRTHSSDSTQQLREGYLVTATRVPSVNVSTSVTATRSSCFTPLVISMRSPIRSPTVSSRTASRSPATTNTRLTP